MAQIALYVTLFLSFCLCFLDTFNTKNVTKAVWIPTIWFMLAISKSISIWLNPSLSGSFNAFDTTGSPIDRAVLILLMFLAVVVLVQRKIEWSRLINKNFLIIILFIYFALSIFWSDFRLTSAKRWFRSLGDLLCALVIITEYSPEGAFKALLKRAGYILIPLSLVLIKYYRYLGVAYSYDGSQEMWIGVTVQKNSLGILCCVIGLFFMNELFAIKEIKKSRFERLTYMVLLFMSVWILFGSSSSRSATAVLNFIVGSLILIWSKLQKKMNLRINSFNTILIILILVLFFSSPLIEAIVIASGRTLTFTGRTFIWDALIKQAFRYPFFGKGYGSFWLGSIGDTIWQQFAVSQGHNGYLEVFLELGLIGLFLLVLIILKTYSRISRFISTNHDFGFLKLTLLIVVLIYNIMESSLIQPTSMMWFLCIILILKYDHFNTTEIIL
jgi:exopolysaccharide production protein ExoQ